MCRWLERNERCPRGAGSPLPAALLLGAAGLSAPGCTRSLLGDSSESCKLRSLKKSAVSTVCRVVRMQPQDRHVPQTWAGVRAVLLSAGERVELLGMLPAEGSQGGLLPQHPPGTVFVESVKCSS